jgi:FAD/FMN-containing dehydrogenase
METLIHEDLAPLAKMGALVDDTILAQTRTERDRIRTWRHHIPETCNRLAAECHSQGGLKVSTEFAVPPDRFLEMMDYVDRSSAEAGVDLLVRYGHVGNAHPHLFTRGRTPEEVALLRRLSLLWVTHAVRLGGTVSGEHGIGKTRRDYLPLMYPPEVISAMRALKRQFDPANILARGNLFPDTPSLVPEFFG